MNDYYQLTITLAPYSEDAADLLADLLAEVGFESFVPTDNGLEAYIAAKDYNADSIADVINAFEMCQVSYQTTLVPGQDWNSEWERHYFQPIVIGGECVVHSSFHTDVPQARYDIVIDPRMAFGTGHHATTSLILNALLGMELEGKSMIDMGTGTGILAILGAMRGAQPVTGIEIDQCAYDNAVDNIALNGHSEIRLIHGDASALEAVEAADLFVANINRNVITADLHLYVQRLKQGGTMLLSGFYDHDVEVIMQTAAPLGLTLQATNVIPDGDPWTCMVLTRQ